MKTKTKKVYVANDGQVFDDRKSCQLHEEYKLYCTPVHLTNEQIINLLEAAFPGPFLFDPEGSNGEISLYVRRDIESETDFDFYFTVVYSNGEAKTYDGSIQDRFRDIAIGLGYEEKSKYHISNDWAYWNHIKIRQVYNYLRSIAFFQKRKEEPDINPIFRKEGWHKIYSKDYTVLYPEIIKDSAEKVRQSKPAAEPPTIIHLK